MEMFFLCHLGIKLLKFLSLPAFLLLLPPPQDLKYRRSNIHIPRFFIVHTRPLSSHWCSTVAEAKKENINKQISNYRNEHSEEDEHDAMRESDKRELERH